MRRAAKKDTTHNEIADALREDGWSVLDLSRLGGGVPDMVVGKPGMACVIEAKSKPGGVELLTEDERKVYCRWTGPYIIASSPDDARRKLAEIFGEG